jgi:hypothetical protein
MGGKVKRGGAKESVLIKYFGTYEKFLERLNTDGNS